MTVTIPDRPSPDRQTFSEVVWSHPAERDLRQIDIDVARRVQLAMNRFAATGHGNVRKLKGRVDQFRLRVGDWRVIFMYEREQGAIQVIRVLPRDHAYQR